MYRKLRKFPKKCIENAVKELALMKYENCEKMSTKLALRKMI